MVCRQNGVRWRWVKPWLFGSWLSATFLLFGCVGQPMESSQPASFDSQQTSLIQKTPSPQQALVYAQEGAAAYEQGDLLSAIDAWQLAVELNPSDAVTHNNLALLLKQKHRFNEAAILLETGLESSPNVAELHYNLAVISELYLLDLNKALTHYQRYQSLSGDEDKKIKGWIADLERRLN